MGDHRAKCDTEAMERAQDERDELRADNERLRGLIKRVEWTSGGPPGTYWVRVCSFCSARATMPPGKEKQPHAADCPAFTPDGKVK